MKVITVALLLLTAVPCSARSAPAAEPSPSLLMLVGLLLIGYLAYKKSKRI